VQLGHSGAHFWVAVFVGATLLDFFAQAALQKLVVLCIIVKYQPKLSVFCIASGNFYAFGGIFATLAGFFHELYRIIHIFSAPLLKLLFYSLSR
jgi:hypothetical protein